MNNALSVCKRFGKSTWFRASTSLVICFLILRSGEKLLNECNLIPDFLSPWFFVACLLAVVYRVVNAYGWALVLRAMNQKASGIKATRIWLLSESRRWLPGGVWGYASRATQASEMNVSPSVASVSMVLELMLTILAALLVSIPVAIVWRAELVSTIDNLHGHLSTIWLMALIIVVVAFASIAFRGVIAKKWSSFKQKFSGFRNVSFSLSGLACALLFYATMACLNGLVTMCLIWSMPVEFPPLTVVIAATAMAWVVGFLAIFAPSGLFVREGVLAICLSLWLPYSTGIAIAVIARVVQIGAELIGMAWVCVDLPKLLVPNKQLFNQLTTSS